MSGETGVKAGSKRSFPYVAVGVAVVLCIALIAWLSSMGIGQGCHPDVNARAWIDTNANGVWDASEPPFDGVTFHLGESGGQGSKTDFSSSVTDWQGDAHLHFPMYPESCPHSSGMVYPDAPQGYRLTTASDVPADSSRTNDDLKFGFISLPGVATATPRPPEPKCTTYTEVGDHIPANRLHGMTLAPDGSLWFVYSYTELAQYLPATDTWKVYPRNDRPVAPAFINAFAITPQNTIWIAQQGGDVLSFDGTTWKLYTKDNGLLDNEVGTIAATTDGNVWILSKRGISIYDAQQDHWQYIRKPSDQVYESIIPSIDGSVIVRVADDGFYVLQSPDAEPRKIRGDTKDFVYAERTDKDGNLWLSTNGRLERVDTKTGESQIFDSDTTKGGYVAGDTRDIAFAADGSVWLASDYGRFPRAIHYIPASANYPSDIWRFYDQHDGIPDHIINSSDGNSLSEVTVMPDGTLWFVEDNTLIHCALP